MTAPDAACAGRGVEQTAAVLHAVWNALAHAIDDQLVGFALIGTAITAGAGGIVVVSVGLGPWSSPAACPPGRPVRRSPPPS
jgi:hypothetical protein